MFWKPGLVTIWRFFAWAVPWCLSRYNVRCHVSIRFTGINVIITTYHIFKSGIAVFMWWTINCFTSPTVKAGDENGIKPNKNLYSICFRHLTLINVLNVMEWIKLYPNAGECLLSCVITSGKLTLNTKPSQLD